jgi:hypothetical protein
MLALSIKLGVVSRELETKLLIVAMATPAIHRDVPEWVAFVAEQQGLDISLRTAK